MVGDEELAHEDFTVMVMGCFLCMTVKLVISMMDQNERLCLLLLVNKKWNLVMLSCPYFELLFLLGFNKRLLFFLAIVRVCLIHLI